MLKEIDLKLFEILDSEIDKTLREGCLIKKNKSFIKVVEDDDFCYLNYKGDLKITYNHFEGDDFNYDVIGHYPTTNTVLRFVLKNKGEFWFKQTLLYKSISIPNSFKWEGVEFKLDITKEICDYTDEQKELLYNFLKSL